MKEKRYYKYIKDISPDELYEGLLSYGFFTDKLPPIFTSKNFFEYCKNKSFQKNTHNFVYFESMKNTNVPRAFGIPTPMAYHYLCITLKDNWSNIQKYFKNTTKNDEYKISRVHIRKQKDKKVIFSIKYEQEQNNRLPFLNHLMGKKYMIRADISTCFPSIYTHAIPWALLGKKEAKKKKHKKEYWQNDIDKACANIRNGETHGLLIGPHASNILSEIILTAIDDKLTNEKWDYIRKIDDYICYVSSHDDAILFLKTLNDELRHYNLMLNHKKTAILELPIATEKDWVWQLKSLIWQLKHKKINYKMAQFYFDSIIKIMNNNDKDSAILNYAIKALSKCKTTIEAKKYCTLQIMHLAIIYPYLFPLLDIYVFEALDVELESIQKFSNLAYSYNKLRSNYEGMYYSIYYALKYKFEILDDLLNDAISNDSCLLKLFVWLYYKDRNDENSLKQFYKHTKKLRDSNDFGRYWIFLYESLEYSDLPNDEWKKLKKSKISFIDQNIFDKDSKK